MASNQSNLIVITLLTATLFLYCGISMISREIDFSIGKMGFFIVSNKMTANMGLICNPNCLYIRFNRMTLFSDRHKLTQIPSYTYFIALFQVTKLFIIHVWFIARQLIQHFTFAPTEMRSIKCEHSTRWYFHRQWQHNFMSYNIQIVWWLDSHRLYNICVHFH